MHTRRCPLSLPHKGLGRHTQHYGSKYSGLTLYNKDQQPRTSGADRPLTTRAAPSQGRGQQSVLVSVKVPARMSDVRLLRRPGVIVQHADLLPVRHMCAGKASVPRASCTGGIDGGPLRAIRRCTSQCEMVAGQSHVGKTSIVVVIY